MRRFKAVSYLNSPINWLRPFCLSYLFLVVLIFFIVPLTEAEITQELTIATWGGSYEQAQQVALFEPFENKTGAFINTQYYGGEIAILQSDILPDIVDMTMDDALIACDQKLIKKLDYSLILETRNQTRNGTINRTINENGSESINEAIEAKNDFSKGSLLPCGIAHLSYSTLFAYDDNAFSGEKPQNIADFFDIKRFPGKRAIQKQPSEILEWALIAEGAPIDQVYDLLSTERGMRLAFSRLDSIKDHLIWWDNPKEPAALLMSGKAVMASGYNGRFFDAQLQGAAISMVWDAHIVDWNVWVIPQSKEKSKESDSDKNDSDRKSNHKLIHEFLRFVTLPESMARLAEQIPYGPSRKSALKHIGLHPDKGFSMRDHLPTAPHHLKRALFRDAKWYARTLSLRKSRFWDWLNAEPITSLSTR